MGAGADNVTAASQEGGSRSKRNSSASRASAGIGGTQLQKKFVGSKWFRAPSASLSKTMSAVLEQKGMEHVLVDAYAGDPHLPVYDARFPTEIYTRGCHWFPRLLA
jgi:hypothetical protein